MSTILLKKKKKGQGKGAIQGSNKMQSLKKDFADHAEEVGNGLCHRTDCSVKAKAICLICCCHCRAHPKAWHTECPVNNSFI